jgi:predicted MFS family arabinose efflux permease
LIRVALSSSLAGALAAMVVVATDNLWAALPALFIFGSAMAASGIAIQTLIQLASAHDMRGRVMGLYGLIFRGAPAIGALGAGILSAYVGLRWTVFFGALLVVAIWLWFFLVRKRIAAALETQGSNDKT